jgi:hypothetical protein
MGIVLAVAATRTTASRARQITPAEHRPRVRRCASPAYLSQPRSRYLPSARNAHAFDVPIAGLVAFESALSHPPRGRGFFLAVSGDWRQEHSSPRSSLRRLRPCGTNRPDRSCGQERAPGLAGPPGPRGPRGFAGPLGPPGTGLDFSCQPAIENAIYDGITSDSSPARIGLGCSGF